MPKDRNFLAIIAYFKTFEIPDVKPACASSVGVTLFVNAENFQDKCVSEGRFCKSDWIQSIVSLGIEHLIIMKGFWRITLCLNQTGEEVEGKLIKLICIKINFH